MSKRHGHDYFDDAAARWRAYHESGPCPGVVVPFGKYRNQPVEALRRDPRYRGWLLEQDWFREKYPDLAQIINTY
jgi:hypothetical protein